MIWIRKIARNTVKGAPRFKVASIYGVRRVRVIWLGAVVLVVW